MVLYSIGPRIGEHRLIPEGIVLPPGTPIADDDYNDVTVIRSTLVIEVASRSTETIDAGNKMVVYAAGQDGSGRLFPWMQSVEASSNRSGFCSEPQVCSCAIARIASCS